MAQKDLIRNPIPGMIPTARQGNGWDEGGGDGALVWRPRNVQQRLFPPDAFNACLAREAGVWRHIQRCGGLKALCPGSHYKDPPWAVMPPQGKRYSKISSIPLPDADGLDHLVTSFTVPTGYDGCIIGAVNSYTGIGFAEGSGDLTWRVRINQRYVKDYGAITTSMGSLQVPYSINAGEILLESGQVVQYLVNRSVASLGNINGGRVICGLFGWWWPR